jgi:hypothetical protein
MSKVSAVLDKVRSVIDSARGVVAQVRKALVVAVPAVGLIVGTDSPLYVKVVAILVALGVYVVPNRSA